MKTEVALIGAGGKMGFRIAKKLSSNSEVRLHCVEVATTGIETLASYGLEVMSLHGALNSSQIAVLAVPDRSVSDVAHQICAGVTKPVLLICLDPAAAYAGVLPERDGISYFVCHPCHPMLFDSQITPDVADDYHGGRAIQDIVCALHLGSEEDFHLGVWLARQMFAPVRDCHRLTVKHMAILEPALVETVAATLLYAIRELQEMVIENGVPEAAVRSFLLGHLRLELGIIFRFTDISFSDGAKLAINNAKQLLLQPGWEKEVLLAENIQRTVRGIVGAPQV